VLLRQLVDDDLGCASYLIGDEEAGEAVLVDPVFDVDPLLDEAKGAGLRVTRVLETHTHADHLSGHGRLALDHDLPVCIHPAADAAYPHEPVEDGDELGVGSVRIRVLHTPGHRPEHCCFLAGDALLTGDSLFVGAVARPDLAVGAREGAEGLFHSLHRLAELPEDVRVFPGHVAGSLCGTGMSGDRSSTIGRELRFNPALALATVDDFVAESTAISTPRPPNMGRIVELNRGPFVSTPQPPEPVDSADGATILDVRDPDAYAAGHVHGALNVPVSGSSFGTRAGFVLRADEPVVLHATSPGEAERAARKLHAVGFLEEVGGYLAHAAATEFLEPVEVSQLDRLLVDGAVKLVDVREKDEHDEGYIPGSLHIPYRLLRAAAGELPRDRPIVTICESGARAAVAASVLVAAGIDARPVLHGGIPDLEKLGHRTVAFRRCGS
jgi:glyoxylase-like metal-dependent hydrolase (beta-lactamase superfamily II)/rhodanese-related sulfurtransferase